jgi:hypothetical protein
MPDVQDMTPRIRKNNQALLLAFHGHAKESASIFLQQVSELIRQSATEAPAEFPHAPTVAAAIELCSAMLEGGGEALDPWALCRDTQWARITLRSAGFPDYQKGATNEA